MGRLSLAEAGSTNDEAAARAAEAPLWVCARRQTAGQGRQGRGWAMPEGNLAASLVVKPDLALRDAALTAFAAAVAVAETLEGLVSDAVIARCAASDSASPSPGAGASHSHGGRALQIPSELRALVKWPNDVLLPRPDGTRLGKAAGILLRSQGGTALDWLVIGIGINLAHAPDVTDAAFPPVAVAQHTSRAPAPERALALLAARTHHWLETLQNDGFAPVRAAWLARAARLGQMIGVRLPDRTLTGRFADVDADGALVLDTGAGTRRIHAADVHF